VTPAGGPGLHRAGVDPFIEPPLPNPERGPRAAKETPMQGPNTDIASQVQSHHCGASHATAGGTGDNSAVTGVGIDRRDFLSAEVVVGWTAVLGEAETLSLAVEYQESSDNSSFDTAVALQASAVVDTGTTGGSTEKSQARFSLNLIGKKRYIRINFTPNLSRANTDVAVCAATLVLGGAVNPPV
jgi:hypothetical protein